MREFSITIQGVTPLICNQFTAEQQDAATTATRSSIVGDRGSPREQAEKKLYRGVDNETLIIPAPNMFRCVIDAGKYMKNGRTKITTQNSSLVPSCVAILTAEISIESKEGWVVDTRPVRIPATRGRILAHRPMFHDWKLSFTVWLDEEIMSPRTFRELVDIAGTRIGLGDFRPDTKGMYGKFKVVEWREL